MYFLPSSFSISFPIWFQDTFVSKFTMFKSNCANKYKIDQDYIKMVQDIKEIIIEHKKSPVEFSKKDRFIICSDNYQMKTVSVDQLKNYLKKAKLFISQTGNIIKNERISA